MRDSRHPSPSPEDLIWELLPRGYLSMILKFLRKVQQLLAKVVFEEISPRHLGLVRGEAEFVRGS